MNTNNNTYTIIYASIVVIVVAFLLSFVSKTLEPMSQTNERIDKKKQILASLNIRDLDNAAVEETYRQVVQADLVVNDEGAVVADGADKDQAGFQVSMKEIKPANLPLYICQVEGQGTKYVVPLTGKGLWGPVWGYLALNDDLRTIYGAFFSHESETAGLGSRITEVKFQNQFIGKEIAAGDDQILLTVVKNGKVKDTQHECDGITGATLTSNGVNDMLQQCLKLYLPYFNTLANK